MNNKKTTNGNEIDNNKGMKADPETLHTSDPQKNMEGPLSSLMHNTGESFDTDESEEEANEEKDEKM
jgi:hypothetical protein